LRTNWNIRPHGDDMKTMPLVFAISLVDDCGCLYFGVEIGILSWWWRERVPLSRNIRIQHLVTITRLTNHYCFPLLQFWLTKKEWNTWNRIRCLKKFISVSVISACCLKRKIQIEGHSSSFSRRQSLWMIVFELLLYAIYYPAFVKENAKLQLKQLLVCLFLCPIIRRCFLNWCWHLKTVVVEEEYPGHQFIFFLLTVSQSVLRRMSLIPTSPTPVAVGFMVLLHQ